MIKNVFLISYFLFFCGCKSNRHLDSHDDRILAKAKLTYAYYVVDINGGQPDAEFEEKGDAEDYVEKFKKFHTYRIVKAQYYANHN
jgi:hypothetical protein